MFKKIGYVFIYCFIVFGCICAGFNSCATNGKLVSDIGNGTTEYRAIQGEIRSGEAELAITGTILEGESRELRSEIAEIGDGIRELEQSIIAGQGTAQDIGDIIQQIRSRPIDNNIIQELRNRGIKTDSIE